MGRKDRRRESWKGEREEIISNTWYIAWHIVITQ